MVTVVLYCLDSQPTPPTGAVASGDLDHSINGHAQQKQWQTQTQKTPQKSHASEMGFFNAVAHHGLSVLNRPPFIQHESLLLSTPF
jgi:hypothetical protein